MARKSENIQKVDENSWNRKKTSSYLLNELMNFKVISLKYVIHVKIIKKQGFTLFLENVFWKKLGFNSPCNPPCSLFRVTKEIQFTFLKLGFFFLTLPNNASAIIRDAFLINSKLQKKIKDVLFILMRCALYFLSWRVLVFRRYLFLCVWFYQHQSWALVI